MVWKAGYCTIRNQNNNNKIYNKVKFVTIYYVMIQILWTFNWFGVHKERIIKFVVFQDNQSAIHMDINSRGSSRNKNIGKLVGNWIYNTFKRRKISITFLHRHYRGHCFGDSGKWWYLHLGQIETSAEGAAGGTSWHLGILWYGVIQYLKHSSMTNNANMI